MKKNYLLHRKCTVQHYCGVRCDFFLLKMFLEQKKCVEGKMGKLNLR